jgi:hypothetical protein
MHDWKKLFLQFKNVKNFHSWTKSHKTQSQAKFELGPLLFILKEGGEIVETLTTLNLNF